MLRIDHICKAFGSRQVLDDVSFAVRPGVMTGFVGGNGAGKTTTMRIIMGVLRADSGAVTFNDAPIDREVAKRFGYMPEERGLYPKMPVLDQIIYLARLHGMSKAVATAHAKELLERLSLGSRGGDTVESLSLGNQQRAQIAAALVHVPDVLILDEPFSGLDPMAVDSVMGLLEELAAKGAPVLFSSHQLDLVERITDDLVIIAGGQIKAAGSREALQNAHAGTRHKLVSPGTSLAWVREVPGASDVAAEGDEVLFDASPAVAQEVLRTAVANGPVTAFERLRPPLSEVFREVIRDETVDEAAGRTTEVLA